MTCKRCNKDTEWVHTCTFVYRVVKYRGHNCSGCWVMKHVFDDLIKNNKKENLSFHDVNIEDNMDEVEQLNIRSIPAIIVFKGEEELWRKIGVVAPMELKEWIYSLTN